MNQLFKAALLGTVLAGACNDRSVKQTTDQFAAGSFGYDLDFLEKQDSVVVLEGDEGRAKVIVSPKYQAKVFTSTADGNTGRSFGWINYKAFAAKPDSHINAYGGENRLWLGPEGGKFSLFFKGPAQMVFRNWKTPAAFDTESWAVQSREGQTVSLRKDMQLVNYAGTALDLSVTRKITLLDKAAIQAFFRITADSAVKMVGYQTSNAMTNTGRESWTEKTGMPCLWMLDMFNPSPATVIIIPYKEPHDQDKVATTDYFGQIPADRIKYQQGVLFFKADGKSRGKLGLSPLRAKTVAGSYDADHQVLTITAYDVDTAGRYLNQEWNTSKPSFSGDAVNAYNDGPLAEGGQLGPFYEIESVSPAAFLKPGESLTHQHAVFHFTGNEAALDKICKAILGVQLDQVKKVF